MSDPDTSRQLAQDLRGLPLPLVNAIAASSDRVAWPAAAEILRAGQYIKVLPLVLSGSLRVYRQMEGRDLLLYYIQPRESCIMSFTAVLENSPSQVYAVTEEPTEAMLLPSRLLPQWVREYPVLNDFFYRQFHQRYTDLLQTIEQLLFQRMDQRVYQYLQAKSRLHDSAVIALRHREIAADLGTAREVVTRVLKKLEAEGLVQQAPGGQIRIL